MDKKTRIVIIAIIIVIGSGLLFVFVTRPNKLSDVSISETDKKLVSNSNNTAMPVVEKGRYSEYVDEHSIETSGTKLLFFHAPWCPQCRALDESIRTTSIPDNVVIIKVDYDSHQALRQKYGVTIQTTVVKINDSGDKIQSYVAYDQPTFSAVQKALLP